MTKTGCAGDCEITCTADDFEGALEGFEARSRRTRHTRGGKREKCVFSPFACLASRFKEARKGFQLSARARTHTRNS